MAKITLKRARAKEPSKDQIIPLVRTPSPNLDMSFDYCSYMGHQDSAWRSSPVLSNHSDDLDLNFADSGISSAETYSPEYSSPTRWMFSSEPLEKKMKLEESSGSPPLLMCTTAQLNTFLSTSLLSPEAAHLLKEEATLGTDGSTDTPLAHIQSVLRDAIRKGKENGGSPPLNKKTEKLARNMQQAPGAGFRNKQSSSSIYSSFPSRSKDGRLELKILAQPEEQHRARYLTEGSRGAVKDRKGTGFPVVKLFGHNKPVTLQVYIGNDAGRPQPHLFYQASKVCGKYATPCTQKKVDGTVVLEIQMLPEQEMTASCDCVGILKERNVDVEQRLVHFGGGTRSKKRSPRCRMVFRVEVPVLNGGTETLQVASAPILCTQPPGVPEIAKKSLSSCPASGNVELFVIGKNFLKDTKVIFTEHTDESMASGDDCLWQAEALPEKEYLHPTHLVCLVPPYKDPNLSNPVTVQLVITSSGKSSEAHLFTYTPPQSPLPAGNPGSSFITSAEAALPAESLTPVMAMVSTPLKKEPGSSLKDLLQPTTYLQPPTTFLESPAPQAFLDSAAQATSASFLDPPATKTFLEPSVPFLKQTPEANQPFFDKPPAADNRTDLDLTQKNKEQLSMFSQMGDAELLRMINPSTFDTV